MQPRIDAPARRQARELSRKIRDLVRLDVQHSNRGRPGPAGDTAWRPLTPTLSQSKRELSVIHLDLGEIRIPGRTRRPDLQNRRRPHVRQRARCWSSCLPLPLGEGWGEGVAASCYARGDSPSAYNAAPQYLQWVASESWPSREQARQACVEILGRIAACAISTDTMPVGTAMMA